MSPAQPKNLHPTMQSTTPALETDTVKYHFRYSVGETWSTWNAIWIAHTLDQPPHEVVLRAIMRNMPIKPGSILHVQTLKDGEDIVVNTTFKAAWIQAECWESELTTITRGTR